MRDIDFGNGFWDIRHRWSGRIRNQSRVVSHKRSFAGRGSFRDALKCWHRLDMDSVRRGEIVASEGDKSGEGDFLTGGRLVPDGREGNVVYARTLLPGEEDTGEGVHIGLGDRLVIRPGKFVITSRYIDEYFNPIGVGGYRPVANTVWTWCQFAGEQLGFFLFFFALARRTDAAHALWVSAIEARDEARKGSGIAHRQAHFRALAAAEVAIIALGRCYRMVCTLVEKYCPGLDLPDDVTKTKDAVLAMRNAFEHIDERAEGKVGRGKVDADALTIFTQPDFVSASILRYQSYELNFESDVLSALIDCRELIMDAIDERAKQRSGGNTQ